MKIKTIIFLALLLTGSKCLYSQASKLVVPTSYVSRARYTAFSPDGKFFLTSNPESITLWDTRTARQISVYSSNEPNKDFGEVAMSGDQRYLVTVANLNLVVWDVDNEQPLKSILANRSTNELFTHVRAQPKGKLFAVQADLNKLQFFDPTKGLPIRTLQHTGFCEIEDFQFSSDGKLIVSADDKGRILVTDVANVRLVKSFSCKQGKPISVTLNPNSTQLFCLLEGNQLVKWDLGSGTNSLISLPAATEQEWKEITVMIDGTISLSTEAGELLLLDAITLKPRKTIGLANAASAYSAPSVSRDGKFYLRLHYPSLELWDVSRVSLVKTVSDQSVKPWALAFLPDNKTLVAGSAEGRVCFWDLSSVKQVDDFLAYTKGAVTKLVVSADGSKLLSSGIGVHLKCWDLSTRQLLWEKDHTGYLSPSNRENHLFFIPGTNQILTEDHEVFVLDANTGNVVQTIVGVDSTFQNQKDGAEDIDVSPDGKYVLLTLGNGKIWLWSLEKGSRLKEILPSAGESYERGYFSADGKTFVIGSPNLAEVWDVNTVSKIKTVKPDSYPDLFYRRAGADQWKNGYDSILLRRLVTGARALPDAFASPGIGALSPNGQTLATVSENNSILIWQADSVLPSGQLLSFLDGEWMILNRENYYLATRSAAQKLHYVINRKVFPFSQFDLQYNRPDKVVSSFNVSDTVLSKAFYKAWLKRIARAGFSEKQLSDQLHLPEIQLSNRDALPLVVEQPKLKIEFTASDKKFKLTECRVAINGLIVKSLPAAPGNLQEEIVLSAGENYVELSCLNEKGAESLKESFVVSYQPKQRPLKKTWFVGIGVSRYKDSVHNLNYADKDVRDLAAVFAKQPGCVVDTLLNEQATKTNILALRQKLLAASVDDQVIVSVNGHGLLSKEMDFYFANHDIDFKAPGITGVSFDDLESLLTGTQARKRVLLIDACHSGDVDKEDLENMTRRTPGNCNTLALPINRGGVVTNENESPLGLHNSFELMKDYFADVSNSSGIVVISAAGGMEYALENNQWKNGAFTYSLLNLLSQPAKETTIQQVKNKLLRAVEMLTCGGQKPTVRKDNSSYDWPIFD